MACAERKAPLCDRLRKSVRGEKLATREDSPPEPQHAGATTGSQYCPIQVRLNANPRAPPLPTLASPLGRFRDLRVALRPPAGAPAPLLRASCRRSGLGPPALCPRPECAFAPPAVPLVDPPVVPLPGLRSGPRQGPLVALRVRRTPLLRQLSPPRDLQPSRRASRKTRQASLEATAWGL